MAQTYFLPYWGLYVSDDFFHSLSLSLSASRLSHSYMSQPDSMLPSLTTNSLLCSVNATSLRQVRNATRTHSSRSPSHSGVIICSLSSISSCASLFSRQLGSPAWSFQSSSAMVTPLLLTPIVPSLSPLALSKFSRTSSMLVLRLTSVRNWTPSQGGFRCGADAMAFSLVDSLRLHRHGHFLQRLLTSKKLLTPAGLKTLWFVSLMSVSRVVCGTCLHVSFEAPCSRSVWVDLSPPLHKAGLSPPFFSTCLSTVWPPLFVQPFLVSLIASDPFHHVCQLYADELVILTASQADLQVALDAVYALAFLFWCRPHQVRHHGLWSSARLP